MAARRHVRSPPQLHRADAEPRIQPDHQVGRPGIRLGLIDQALDPVLTPQDTAGAERLIQLKRDLAAVVSAEAFFSLTDLCALSADDAIASLVRTAQAITRAALSEIGPAGSRHQAELPGPSSRTVT